MLEKYSYSGRKKIQTTHNPFRHYLQLITKGHVLCLKQLTSQLHTDFQSWLCAYVCKYLTCCFPDKSLEVFPRCGITNLVPEHGQAGAMVLYT